MTDVVQLRKVLAAHVALPDADDAPLELDSFDEVVVIETLEQHLGVTLRAADVAAARPLSLRALGDLVGQA